MGRLLWHARQILRGSTLLPPFRSAVTALLALLLLAPAGFGLLLPASAPQPDCGMQCCKRTKVCCCRKSGSLARQNRPGWAAAPVCATRCRQLPALPGAIAASLAPQQAETKLAECPLPAGTSYGRAPRSSETDFALFERPPPAT